MTHMHFTAWIILLILFFVTLPKPKPPKSLHMIIRLFYLIVIATGLDLVFRFQVFSLGSTGEYIGKIILGILVIGFMEMVLVKKSKGQPVKGFLIGFWITLILVILLGLRLPLGFRFF
ncbi:YisL family protein [Thermoflavimicrobium daqui]|uniref:UPF0344 protein DL897_11910 n=1 Tax=Thermoflavimicrobium daqui TaxID=2137476 RepID=A0A364K3H4_9BACL|nr:YisL family protein [Thermoflavimicrobium daqui]RAL23387.1 hypothetical protein DL897_11910 [Thermoflavimicrobium daqui]